MASRKKEKVIDMGLPRSLCLRNHQALLGFMAAALLALPATACPVRIPLGPIAATSAAYQVYRYQPAHSKKSRSTPASSKPSNWRQVPWQLLTTRGKDTPADFGMTLSRYFGPAAPSTAVGPCGPTGSKQPAFELREFIGGRYQALYFYACPRPLPDPAADVVAEMSQSVVTPDYYYRYEGENKLLFASLALSKISKGSYHLIAAAANQQLIGNFKNFFTMVFDDKDFHVRELLSQRGPVGVYSQLNFLLKVLGMKVNLDLVTDVYFYPEGMYTPMILHMPLDAKKYLKKGSGVIYSWDQQPDFSWQASDVPNLSAMADIKGVLARYCRARCNFSIKGSSAAVAHDVYLHFRLPRYLVAKGFFPVYFADEAKLAAAIGHKVTTARSKTGTSAGRTGFYFEAFDLHKGSHRWDLAIDTRKPAELRPLPCGDLAGLMPKP